MTSVELELGKLELIRDVMSISNSITLANMKAYIKDLLRKDNATKGDVLTQNMIRKYAGKWKDDRSSDEVIEDIYNARLSHNAINNISPFDV